MHREDMKINQTSVCSNSSVTAGVQIHTSGIVDPQRSRAGATGLKVGALPQSLGVVSWSDAKLISSISRDPPDEEALGILVNRYWNSLFGRCQMLTSNREKALDLAQAAWCRMLQNRHVLKPDGNFPAYINTIATNLFRDSYRAAQRAGPMAEYRLESLDGAYPNNDGETVALVDIVPDLKSLHAEEQTLLAIDIDVALEQLTPQLREVLVARFIDGESCAEIGLKYGRTEQAVSGWIREALRQMKIHLEETRQIHDTANKEWQSENPLFSGAFSSVGGSKLAKGLMVERSARRWA